MCYRICVILGVDTYTYWIFNCNTVKKMCFEMYYRIYVVLSRGSHLHISYLPLQNGQNDVFRGGLRHLCCFNSWLKLTKIEISIAKQSKRPFWKGLSRLCYFQSELRLSQIGFSIVKGSKRRILKWIIAFVLFQFGVDTYTNRIFNRKMVKKACFAMDYSISVVLSRN